MLKKFRFLYLVALLFSPILSRDVLVEFKAGNIFPTGELKEHGLLNSTINPIYGPEITFQLSENKNWYGFVQSDLMFLSPFPLPITLGLGVKYFVPHAYGDFYVGLGYQPKINIIAGGVAKMGNYFRISDNFFIDLFLDYSFYFTDESIWFRDKLVTGGGLIVGAGIGYRF